MLLLIANDGPLPPEWKDHSLNGDWADHCDCHIGGDFLLIYRVVEGRQPGSVVFVRTGMHADFFD